MSDDLIKRQDAMEVLHRIFDAMPLDSDRWLIQDIRSKIADIPSADRPQGEWIEKNNGYDTTCECSVCHYRNFIPNYQVGSKYVCMDRYWFKRNFCPSCGARMKGADDE